MAIEVEDKDSNNIKQQIKTKGIENFTITRKKGGK